MLLFSIGRLVLIKVFYRNNSIFEIYVVDVFVLFLGNLYFFYFGYIEYWMYLVVDLFLDTDLIVFKNFKLFCKMSGFLNWFDFFLFFWNVLNFVYWNSGLGKF